LIGLQKQLVISALMKRKFLIFCFLILSSVVYSKPAVSYPYRNINKPIISDANIKKIIVFSPPRTGSTLVYMVLQYLFETTLGNWISPKRLVLKAHELKHCLGRLRTFPQCHVVITIRDPLEAYLSRLLIEERMDTKKALNLSKELAIHYNEVHYFIQKRSNEKLHVFRYEDFENDLDKLLSDIEDGFSVSIPPEKKIAIKTFFSKETIQEKIKKYKNFRQYDSCTGLHGNHIATHKPTLSELFPPLVCKEILRNLSQACTQFNYAEQKDVVSDKPK